MGSLDSVAAMKPIAVVGLSFKMPQDAVDESGLWEILENKKNVLTDWPQDRAALNSLFDNTTKNPNTISGRGSYFLKQDPATFDAPFFSITAKEAATIDPQQRLALEVAYHALENAGIPVQSLSGSLTGVYGASMTDDWIRMSAKDPDSVARQNVTGCAPSILANRISWQFNLRGPSIHVDTACSSSMTALDMACQAIHAGDATAALIVGTSVLLSPEISLYLANLNFLSSDSRCYSFDERANGYARGEGIVALFIKPLADALKDGDVIRAVIRATASNQDGKTPGITQPNAQAQEALIRHTYAKARLPLQETQYVEAHGTGTPTGDPIETNAIGRAFGEFHSPEDPVFVGSIKANIGHLEGASGLAGVVKSIIMLERGIIPGQALFEKLNPSIPAAVYNMKIPTQNTPWPKAGQRRISVNSFGFGGANAHVILDDALHYLQGHGLEGYHHCLKRSGLIEEAIVNGTTQYSGNFSTDLNQYQSESDGNPPIESGLRLLVWSAASEDAIHRTLQAYDQYYLDHISGDTGKLEQLAYTLAVRRSLMSWRTYAVVGGTPNAERSQEGKSTFTLSSTKPMRAPSTDIGTAFVFTGQGAQYADMGMELLQYPVFEQSLRRSDEAFVAMGSEWSLFDEIHNSERISQPEFSQPLCTALQIALVDLLRSFKILPVAVVGHSSGEIAAAYAIGALSQASACRVAYFRGQFASEARATSEIPGAMLSTNLRESDVPEYLEKLGLNTSKDNTLHIACFNSPTNLTISGPATAIGVLKSQLDSEGIFAQEVKTGVAYHSPAMQTIAEKYAASLTSIQSDASTTIDQDIPMVSSVTASVVKPETLATPQYWVNNLVSPVRFTQAVQYLSNGMGEKPTVDSPKAVTDMIEIGPHAALRRPLKDTAPQLRYHSWLQRSKPTMICTLELIGSLFNHGYPVSVAAVNGQNKGSLPFLIDCPPYPFDRSRQYWNESRLSKGFRLRGGTLGLLLGRRVVDWNPLQPRWRNWLSVETIPWLADHVISKTTLCPGAGMLIMAIEAVMEVADTKNRVVSGFRIQDAQFLAPIRVSETLLDATETELHLKHRQRADNKSSTWFEIRIFTHHNEQWTECFQTNIQIQFEEDEASAAGRELHHEHDHARRFVESISNSCTAQIESGGFYDFCSEHGLSYGKSFQLLRDISWDRGNSSAAYITLPTVLPGGDNPVHPAVIDAAFHLILAQASKGLSPSAETPTLVPQRIAKAWISAKPWTQSTASIRLGSVATARSLGVSSTIYGLADDGSLLCAIEDLGMAEVSRTIKSSQDPSRALLYSIEWKPKLSSLQPDELHKVCDSSRVVHDSKAIAAFFPKMEMAMRSAARKALKAVPEKQMTWAPNYMLRYAASLREQGNMDSRLFELSDAALESLLQECEMKYPQWFLFPTIARALPLILRGEKDPLELMFATRAAESFYEYLFNNHMRDGRLQTFLHLASHEKPGLRILEVGAGTGSFTRHILTALQAFEDRTGGVAFEEYTFTDISPSFLDSARTRFKDWAGRMSFKLLDLELDPAREGSSFDLESYDIILAGSVLHATSSIRSTLEHLRKLLKPGGHLVFQEITAPDCACINISYGTLQGWWLAAEEWRQTTPNLTQQRWNEMLSGTGFSGVDLALRDHEEDICHISTLMIAKAVQEVVSNGVEEGLNNSTQANIIVLMNHDSVSQNALVTELITIYKMLSIISLDEINEGWAPASTDVVICLLEVEEPWLATLGEMDFQKLQNLIQGAQDMLWVSSLQEGDIGAPNPHSAVSTGFLRGVRSENNEKHFVSLSVESSMPNRITGYIKEIMESCFGPQPSSELEYVVRDDRLMVGRLKRETQFDARHKARIYPTERNEEWARGPPVLLSVGTPGALDSLQFVEDPAWKDDLKPNEVEVNPVAWGVSFRDLLIALGKIGNAPMGFECAGVVTRVGEDYTEKFKPGDRVAMIAFECLRSRPRAEGHCMQKIPDDLGFNEAIASANGCMTIWHALITVARLQKGEKILIHCAAGGTGQVAVEVAKMVGAEIYVTVGSDEKKQLLMDHFGIPQENVFYSRDTSFAQGIKRVTNGYGVDVIVNSLSGDSLTATWECIAPYGRFIEIGKADINSNSSLPMALFAKNVSFAAVDLQHIVLSTPGLTGELFAKTMELVSSRQLRGPRPLHCYPLSNVEKAFRYMQSGKNTGRVILNKFDDDKVTKFMVDKSSWTFSADATYIVAGGLGGLGRSMIRWMADKGARNFIIPSRSGVSSQAASDLVDDLKKRGVCVVTPRCDVSSESELSETLQYCTSFMPPIKGCINSAMALQDSIFSNMSHTQWHRSIQSKVHSSWNLHRLLPSDMDFFILLSSLSGIYGTLAQSNYAAGCTFQDALARSRTAAGLGVSVSLDLGWMIDAGIISERAEYKRTRQTAQDMAPVTAADLNALLDHYCDPELKAAWPEGDASRSQILVGPVIARDFTDLEETIPSFLIRPLFEGFNAVTKSQAEDALTSVDTQKQNASARFRAATTSRERTEIFFEAIKAKLARALGILADDVDGRKTLADYGVDSLMAVELRNWIRKDFGVDVAVFEILGHNPIVAVGDLVTMKAEAISGEQAKENA